MQAVEPEAPPQEAIYRHGRAVRVTHWLNAFFIFALIFTGFGITQLHAPLYLGDAGQDWGAGIEEINGAARDPYPSILHVPQVPWVDLREKLPAMADFLGTAEVYVRNPTRVRDHIFFAWLFLFNGLVYLAAGLASGRFRTLLRPSRRDLSWRKFARDFWDHVRLRFHKGGEARSYNLIQKYTYLTIIFVVLPLQLLTGFGLLPWMDAGMPWFKDVFGGRQTMRTIHFACSLVVAAFILVHLAMVVLSGFRNNIRSMITGWYRLPR
ncbi:cytochrome b/b6 domain-containing protein [Sphingomonas sp. MG17]|uniref:Cytochrome b/b6 domain-containing protein n=1 Tax=Sphingomonas tagetis TaxID=2949092 RepID=A0A9X2HJT6_9SPHN|nr:cytochrome b/b6 domain-containing protein [Sphingomonas tagetis]MCP3732541.1 cytochrome b/b6 domain-containing protein [Sphingomonas tagetis]